MEDCYASSSYNIDDKKTADTVKSVYFLDGIRVPYSVIREKGQKGELAGGQGADDPKKAIILYGEKFRKGVWFINSKDFQDNSFQLTGKIAANYNGDQIMLFTFRQDTIFSVDTTIINNGAFSFQGKEYTDNFSIVTTGNYPDKVISSEVILNKGVIHVELDSIRKVWGGELNDKLLAFQDSLQLLFEKQKGISEDSSRINNMKNIVSYIYNFSIDNRDNLLGIRTFKNYISSIAQTDSLRFEKLCDVFDKDRKSDEVKIFLDYQAKNIQRLQSVNKKYEDFEFQTPEGNTRKLSDYVGKSQYIYIDFWASWCNPCIAAMPHLKEIYEKYRSKGFEVIGISLDTDKKSWKKALKRIDAPWIQLCNYEGSESKMARAYFITAIPYGILLDKEGTIIETNYTLEKKLQELFDIIQK